MAFDKTNTGALFKNKDKQSDKHPDYKGSANVNGQEFWLSAWLKKSKNGETFMSLAIKAKEDISQRRQEKPKQETSFQDDDLPW